MARAALQGVGEAESAAELAQVPLPPELQEERGVVRARKIVVEARAQGLVTQGRRDALDKGREFGGGVGLCGRRFKSSPDECGRRGQGERGVLFDWHERIDEGRVEHRVEFVGEEEEGSHAPRVA